MSKFCIAAVSPLLRFSFEMRYFKASITGVVPTHSECYFITHLAGDRRLGDPREAFLRNVSASLPRTSVLGQSILLMFITCTRARVGPPVYTIECFLRGPRDWGWLCLSRRLWQARVRGGIALLCRRLSLGAGRPSGAAVSSVQIAGPRLELRLF